MTFALILLGAIVVIVAYRFALPLLLSRVNGFAATNQALKKQNRLESILPPHTRHATYGGAFLTEDVPGVQSGSILDEMDMDNAALAATANDFVVLNDEGETLLTVPLVSLALGLPAQYDTMADPYFYFLLLETNLALAVRVHDVVRTSNAGTDEFGRWDGLIS